MDIKTESLGAAEVIRLLGSADTSAVASVRDALAKALKAADNHVVCDLSEVDFVCSDILGVFISAQQQARDAGGFLRLVHPQRRIAEILQTTQLDRLFGIYETVPEAIAGVGDAARK
jgi:anti-anti-sigma factor